MLLSERSTQAQIGLAVVAPALLGAVAGFVLGHSQTGYLILSLLAALGGIGAGFEHDGASAGAKRGLLGGTIYGSLILVAHQLDNVTAKADLPSPQILLIAVTALFGVVIGAGGGAMRAKRGARSQN